MSSKGLDITVTWDNGVPGVVELDGVRKVKIGTRHASGKNQALFCCQWRFNFNQIILIQYYIILYYISI